MVEHIKFPKINSMRNAQSYALKMGISEPLPYIATVKVHGTNAAILRWPDGSVVAQSRNRIITPDDDNQGFASWVESLPQHDIDALIYGDADGVVDGLFGEWVGRGVGKGTAMNTLDRKVFVVFARYVRNASGVEHWSPPPPSWMYHTSRRDIISLADLPTYNATVDFATGEISGIDDVMMAIENQCPVASVFGASGCAEGLVLLPHHTGYWQQSELWIKVKTESYITATGEKMPKQAERQNSDVLKIAQEMAHPRRLQQGVEFLVEMGIPVCRASTGQFVRWVQGDARDEDGASDLVAKAVGGIAARWFLANAAGGE